jgi:hypothetical protein
MPCPLVMLINNYNPKSTPIPKKLILIYVFKKIDVGFGILFLFM